MKTINNYEDSCFFDDLDEAVLTAFENDSHEGIWVQKYEKDGIDMWMVSLDKKVSGVKLFKELQEKSLFMLYDNIIEGNLDDDEFWINHIVSEDKFIRLINKCITDRWDEKNTINLKEEYFSNEYEMYGVAHSDFF